MALFGRISKGMALMLDSLNVVLLAVWSSCLCLADSLDASGALSPVMAASYQQGIVVGLVVVAAIGWSVWIFLKRQKLQTGRSAVTNKSPTPTGPTVSLFDQLADAHGLSHADADLLRDAAGDAVSTSVAEVFVNPELLSRFAETRPDSSSDCQRLIERLFGGAVSGVTAGGV